MMRMKNEDEIWTTLLEKDQVTVTIRQSRKNGVISNAQLKILNSMN